MGDPDHASEPKSPIIIRRRAAGRRRAARDGGFSPGCRLPAIRPRIPRHRGELGFPRYIGNKYAPILNALAADHGLATDYRGAGDPSERNYVAMLGGDTFGIANDDPYWFPGHSIDAQSLMSQLEREG